MKKFISIALAFLIAFIFVGPHNPRLKPVFDIFKSKTVETSAPVVKEETTKPEFKVGKGTFVLTAEDDADTKIEVTYYSDFYYLSQTNPVVFYNEASRMSDEIEKYKNNSVNLPEHFYLMPQHGRTGFQITLYKDISAEDIWQSKKNDSVAQQIMTYSDITTYTVDGKEYKYFEASFNDNPENKAYRFCTTEIEGCTLLFQITTMYKGNIAEMCDTVISDVKLN